MKTYTAVVERCPETGLYVGYVPGFPGAHSQGETLDELNANLREVIAMILEDGAPAASAHRPRCRNERPRVRRASPMAERPPYPFTAGATCPRCCFGASPAMPE